MTKCKEPRAADEIRLHRVIGYLAEYKDLELHCKVTDLQLHAYLNAYQLFCRDTLNVPSPMIIDLKRLKDEPVRGLANKSAGILSVSR